MIDFSLTSDQNDMLLAVEDFLDRRLPPDEVRRRDEAHQTPYDLLPELADLGVLGIPFDAKYGGLGERWITLALVQEAIAKRAYFAASIVSRVVAFGGMSLMSYGTESQRERLLPDLINGKALFALALSEPDVGSDASAIKMRAERVDGGWSLTGRKTWISDAEQATHLVVPARSDKGAQASRGITVFLVPRHSEGVTMTPLAKVGNNCMPSFDIGFDGVFVEEENLMGVEGKGLSHILSTLHYSRASMSAGATGCAQSAVDLALRHAKDRVQFGQPIGKNQIIQHRLVDMQMSVDQSRLSLLHLAWLISNGMECRRQSAQAKVIATESLQRVAQDGMQILASAGYSNESAMQRIWRDSRLYTFGEGSNEIQRNTIAKELGL